MKDKIATRKTTTFTEVMSRDYDVQKGAWGDWQSKSDRVDDQINKWSEETGNVILSIHAATTYVNDKGDDGSITRHQIIRHTVVWVDRGEFVAEEAAFRSTRTAPPSPPADLGRLAVAPVPPQPEDLVNSPSVPSVRLDEVVPIRPAPTSEQTLQTPIPSTSLGLPPQGFPGGGY